MGLDLFGNSVGEKALTSMQRIVTRQAVSMGRDLYTTEPGDRNKGQNMIDYCVIMWKPPYRGDAVLRWIV